MLGWSGFETRRSGSFKIKPVSAGGVSRLNVGSGKQTTDVSLHSTVGSHMLGKQWRPGNQTVGGAGNAWTANGGNPPKSTPATRDLNLVCPGLRGGRNEGKGVLPCKKGS